MWRLVLWLNLLKGRKHDPICKDCLDAGKKPQLKGKQNVAAEAKRKRTVKKAAKRSKRTQQKAEEEDDDDSSDEESTISSDGSSDEGRKPASSNDSRCSSSSEEESSMGEEEEEEEEEDEDEKLEVFKDADAGISAATSAMPPPDGFTAAHAENQAALRYMMEHKPSLLSLWKLTTNDECEHCSFGGDVLTCSFCNLAWHNTTVCLRGAPLARSEDNEDHWACPPCWGHATRRHAKGPKRKAAGGDDARKKRRQGN